MYRRLSPTLLAALLLVSLPDTSEADAADTVTCGGEQSDTIFVRLIDIERTRAFGFAVPVSNYRTDRWNIEEPIVPPADPSAPPGCPENPIHIASGLSVRVTNVMEKLRSNTEAAYHLACAEFGKVEAGDFTTCVTADGREGVPRSARLLYAMANQNAYRTPLGQPFVFSCLASITGEPPRRYCSLAYSMEPGLGLLYTFSEARMPIEELIEHDREVRKSIQEMRCPDLDVQ